MSYLIDTNVISEIVKLKPHNAVLNWFKKIPTEDIYLSVLTLGELRKGIEQVTETKKKGKLRIWLEHELPTLFGSRILLIDEQVVDRWGRLQAEMRRSIPAIDSLIAATALHHDLCVVTRNIEDFNFPALEKINPWN
jgi:predicted nucleic acid-binding protein